MTSLPERLPPTIRMTGGPNPPATMNLTTGGPNPPVPVGGGTPGTTPNTSPIPIMNWQAKLAQGDENAQTRGVGSNELVQNRLTGLIDSNSQYITQAEDRARSEASSRGMMMSTMAAGAGRRAAIDAALPIASQDAATYGKTASENMAATNADRLADQQMFGQLTGQEVGIRANLDESERSRGFTADQNQLNRQFQTGERLGTQSFQQNMQQMQNAWQGAQNNTQRQHELTQLENQQAHDSSMRILDQKFQGTQLDKQLLQQRFLEFENAMGTQSQMLSQTIASIYNNPNLTAAQQNQAVANARSVYQSIFTSYAASLAGGMPPIFYQPYQMSGSSATSNPPVLTQNPPPGYTPPPGGYPPPPGTNTNTGGGTLRVGPMLNFSYTGSGSSRL